MAIGRIQTGNPDKDFEQIKSLRTLSHPLLLVSLGLMRRSVELDFVSDLISLDSRYSHCCFGEFYDHVAIFCRDHNSANDIRDVLTALSICSFSVV